MKTFKLILGITLWMIVAFSSFYLYNFSNQKDNFISVYTHIDSSFYKDALEKYKMQNSHIDKTFDTHSFGIINSYSVLDSLKKNDLITMRSILDNLPKNKNIYLIPNDMVQIGEETTNPKIKELYKIWLIRLYEKVWINEAKKIGNNHYGYMHLSRVKDDSIGLYLNTWSFPEIYLKQEIDINEEQNKFSITTHYFGRDTLIVKKNYRITTPKGQKIKPFDYQEILP